ncbi:MAG: D-Ala-D-Ala carboxypeptidase family metallohydrolase [Hyphomicrobiaceae bacterium]
MHGPRPRVIALAVALAAVGTLTLLPDSPDASSSCLPSGLKARLAQVSKKFGHVQIISTYRRGARMPNGHPSFHASCRAVDFNPPRGKYSEVASWLKANHGGGVGTYSCGMHHIHIDNGPRIRFHHCQSAAVMEEIDGEALRAAKAEWATKPGQGAWPLVLPTPSGNAARL